MSDVVRKSFFLLWCISKVRKPDDTPTCNTLVCSLVFPHLDYCNSLLAGTPMSTLDRLQRVQNAAAKVVAGRARVKSERLESIRSSLHWLPIRERIDYKIAILTFKALSNMAPSYLVELVNRYQPPRPLRSANHNLLQTSQIRLARYGARSFSHVASDLWNSLPENIRSSNALSQFSRLLKSHLFDRAYRQNIVQ